uniref:Uncharacterized protein LOC111105985 n=1 Tax=Crassostrea virginica TaxID=6565 RepID=A0A8B8AYI3_CRAVI|nr:uncharacterized protein LOC111105985 [Crassostrea virginica]
MYSYYFNGSDCAVCPKGTTGVNCSSICTPPTHGDLCSQTSALEKTTTTTFTGTTNKTQERKTERDRDKKDINTIIRYRHYIKILVILAGTVLSLTLLLLIAREIFKLLQMSETSGDYQASMDAYVVNYTSGDITESLYNSRGTQE